MGAVKDVYLGLQGYDHWKTTEPQWDCFDEEPITPEQEKLLAEEQEADMAEIDAERAREERRRVLEEAVAIAKAHKGTAKAERLARGMKLGFLDREAQTEIAAEERGEDIAADKIADAIHALIDKEPSRG